LLNIKKFVANLCVILLLLLSIVPSSNSSSSLSIFSSIETFFRAFNSLYSFSITCSAFLFTASTNLSLNSNFSTSLSTCFSKSSICIYFSLHRIFSFCVYSKLIFKLYNLSQ
jgi:hypothetical protein